MTRPPSSHDPSAPTGPGSVWLRALAVVLLLVGAGAVVHAVRLGYAAWIVFPAPELQPIFERAVGPDPNPLGRLETVTELVPGDARYWHLRAEAERRRAHDRWFDDTATTLLERARAHAERAAELVPTNPYHRELVATLLLDLARRRGGSTELVQSAVQRLREALDRAPGSPVVAQRVGLDLVRAWSQLDEEGRELAAQSLLQAATWHGAYLVPAHETITSHLPLPEAIALAGAVTPPTPDGARRLEGFLRRVAARIPARSPDRERIAPAVIDAGANLLRRSEYPAGETLEWALWGARTFPGQRPRMIEITRAVHEQDQGRPGPLLALAALVQDPEERLARAQQAVAVAEDRSPEEHRLALSRHAIVLEEEGRPEEALAVYERMAALAPDQAEPLLDAARVLQSLARRAEALEVLETATSRDPLSLDARRALGAAYYDRSQFQRAIDTWRHVAQRAPRDAATRLQLARAYEQLGRFDDAERYYESAAELDGGLQQELDRFRARIVGAAR